LKKAPKETLEQAGARVAAELLGKSGDLDIPAGFHDRHLDPAREQKLFRAGARVAAELLVNSGVCAMNGEGWPSSTERISRSDGSGTAYALRPHSVLVEKDCQGNSNAHARGRDAH
jgi:hypothetical protein